MSDLAGRLIASRYLVQTLVASGGMASVYRARDSVLEREVALKIIHPHLATDKSFVEKFRREAKMAAKLSHPNLVNVFDQGTDGEITFLVMEFVPGITLRDAMNDFGILDASRTLEIIEPLTAGLAAAHSAGILHRDLKPENIFLDDNGSVKLGDFGLARAITQHTETGSVVGTVAYLSPELVTRGQADARSDIYSLGVMIFEMLTGKQPFEGEQAVQIAYQHANDRIPAPSSFKPGIPPLLDEIVLWATARNPKDRPANAKELLPVIKRARSDIDRGLTTNLEDLAATARVTWGEDFAAPDGATEVIDEQLLDQLEYRSEIATKLTKSNKRAGRLLVLLTVFAVFASAGSGWWFATGPGGQASVPELSGRSVEVAIAALEPIGLKVLQEQEHSLLVPVGFVTRTDPPAGSMVSKQSEITLFISLGPKQVLVPDVPDADLAEAQALLVASELEPGAVTSYFSSVAAGKVIEFSLPSGTETNQGTVVDIQISLGPLPDVRNDFLDQAKQELQALGVVVTEALVFSDEVAKGLVVAMTPETEPLKEGGSVRLDVSKGPEFATLPNMVGETVAAAKRTLEGLGLEVTVDTDALTSAYGVVRVVRQSPVAGQKVLVGSRVTVYTR
jgi:serine/threonine protein kinase/beta-lactam-binding protein with PASTA domain